MDEVKWFVWLTKTSQSGKDWKISTPYFNIHTEILGRPSYSTLDDLLKLNLSESLKKRLISCREGTTVYFESRGTYSKAYVRRLTQEEITVLEEFNSVKNGISNIQSKIEERCQELFEEKKKLEKELRFLKKKVDKFV